MKVKCIAKEFDLTVGKVYLVYGMLHGSRAIKYLISDKQYNFPNWYPAELFEVIDHSLPISWYFNFCGYDKHVNAIWGYKELLNSNHFINILERKEKDLDIFFERKKEINLDENFRDYMKTLTCEEQAKIKNKAYVIQKILELHDVNFFELIFFGMIRGFIDND